MMTLEERATAYATEVQGNGVAEVNTIKYEAYLAGARDRRLSDTELETLARTEVAKLIHLRDGVPASRMNDYRIILRTLVKAFKAGYRYKENIENNVQV